MAKSKSLGSTIRGAPTKHFERVIDTSAPSKNMKATEGSDFNPKAGKDRKSVYVRVNETDH